MAKAKLSKDDNRILKAHGIARSQMFDASGMRRSEYHPYMKAIGKYFAYGVTPCRNAGHTLRSRVGRCIQCEPAAISFMRMQDRTAYVYIAGSKSLRFVKIGHSQDPEKRIYDGNCAGYGGASDWRVLTMVSVDKAPEIEQDVQARLAEHAAPTKYHMGDKLTTGRECFACGYPEALNALVWALLYKGLFIEERPVPEGYDF